MRDTLLIEHIAPGKYRVANSEMHIDVTGPTLEDALVRAAVQANVGNEEDIHGLAGSFLWAGVLQTVMEHGTYVEGHQAELEGLPQDYAAPGRWGQ